MFLSKNREIFKKTVSSKNVKFHILFYYLLKILTGFSSLLLIITIIQLSGQSEYGKYALISSIILALNSSLSGWINQIILRFFDFENIDLLFTKCLTLSAILSLSTGILILMPFYHTSKIFTKILIILFFITLFFYSISNTIMQKNYLLPKIAYSELTRIITLFMSITFFSFILKKSLNINLILTSVVLSYISALIILTKGTNLHILSLSSFIKEYKDILIVLKTNRKYLLYGISIGLWFLLASLLNVSDRYIIKYFYSLKEVGIYSSVYDIIYKICTFALTPILTAIHPHIMNAYNKKDNNYKSIIKKAINLELKLLPALIIVTFGLSLFSEKLLKTNQITFLSLAYPILIGSFLWNFAMVLHKFLEVKNQTFKMVKLIGISLTLNIIGNFVLIPILGYVGAAYTTLMGFGIYILLVMNEIRGEV